MEATNISTPVHGEDVLENEETNIGTPTAGETAAKKGGLSLSSMALLGAIIVVAVVVGLQLLKSQQAQPHSGPAPDFTLTTFDGDTFRLSDQQGKVVLINFWAQWCGPCRAEAPALQATWEYYQDRGDVVFVGVAWADNGPKTMQYIEDYNITFINGPDLGTKISEDYNIQGVPETFIVDKDGNIAKFIYAGVTQPMLTSIIDPLLES